MPLASTVHPIRSGRPSRTRRSVRAVGAALAAVLAIGLSACSPDPGQEAFLDSGEKGYVSANLKVVLVAPDKREEPVEFAGVTESGDDFDSADIAGDVTVVNFWYAACGPCRGEAKDLQAVWEKFEDQDVSFIGINIYDQADTAAAFNNQYGVTYPSIIDVDTGDAKLAFAAVAPIQAPPVTLVLDQQGRVAARIIGQLESASILSSIVKDTLAESA